MHTEWCPALAIRSIRVYIFHGTGCGGGGGCNRKKKNTLWKMHRVVPGLGRAFKDIRDFIFLGTGGGGRGGRGGRGASGICTLVENAHRVVPGRGPSEVSGIPFSMALGAGGGGVHHEYVHILENAQAVVPGMGHQDHQGSARRPILRPFSFCGPPPPAGLQILEGGLQGMKLARFGCRSFGWGCEAPSFGQVFWPLAHPGFHHDRFP